MWMINNYIKSTCDNYIKLVYLLKIIDIFSEETTDVVDIGISTSSIPIDQDGKIFEDKLIECIRDPQNDKDRRKYCYMYKGEKDVKKNFWHFFSSCERPICFALKKDGEIILLHDPRGEEGIKVRDVSYHSPINIGLGGIGELVEHLVNAGTIVENNRRQQEEHESRMVTQAMQTLGEGMRVQAMIQNARLQGGHAEYAQNMYDALMAKQEKLNEAIGIRSNSVDTRA